MGLVPPLVRDIVRGMQLIQIGQPASFTIQQLIEQMAAEQSAEIVQLRQTALAHQSEQQARRVAAARTRRYRQSSSSNSTRNLAATRLHSVSL